MLKLNECASSHCRNLSVTECFESGYAVLDPQRNAADLRPISLMHSVSLQIRPLLLRLLWIIASHIWQRDGVTRPRPQSPTRWCFLV